MPRQPQTRPSQSIREPVRAASARPDRVTQGARLYRGVRRFHERASTAVDAMQGDMTAMRQHVEEAAIDAGARVGETVAQTRARAAIGRTRDTSCTFYRRACESSRHSVEAQCTSSGVEGCGFGRACDSNRGLRRTYCQTGNARYGCSYP
jgi:hypothetical protein